REVADVIELRPPEDLAGRTVDGRYVEIRRLCDRARADHEQVLDRVRDRGQPNGFGDGAVRPDLGDIEGRHRAVISAEDQPGLRRVASQVADSGGRCPRDGLARPKVLGPDLGAGRDVQALPGAHGAVLAAWLDRDGSDGVPEL